MNNQDSHCSEARQPSPSPLSPYLSNADSLMEASVDPLDSGELCPFTSSSK